jgi:hypothetical protein
MWSCQLMAGSSCSQHAFERTCAVAVETAAQQPDYDSNVQELGGQRC